MVLPSPKFGGSSLRIISAASALGGATLPRHLRYLPYLRHLLLVRWYVTNNLKYTDESPCGCDRTTRDGCISKHIEQSWDDAAIMTDSGWDKDFLDASILDTVVPEETQGDLDHGLRSALEDGSIDAWQRSTLFFGMENDTSS